PLPGGGVGHGPGAGQVPAAPGARAAPPAALSRAPELPLPAAGAVAISSRRISRRSADIVSGPAAVRPRRRKERTPVIHAGKRHGRGRARLLGWLLALGPLAAAGCGFWGGFRSRAYSVQAFFVHETPRVVLQSSTDGNKRARAFADLREPKQYGGTQEEQDVVVRILITAASHEPQSWCRLKAIEALSTFK